MRVGAAFLVLGLILPIVGVGDASVAGAASTARPNVIFILTDDLDATTYDPAAFPALRALMTSQGVTFSHFFVDDSLCCPSRATILRGQYVHNTGVLNNGPPTGGFERFHANGLESSTVATWLHARGYRTGLFGKYLNGYPNTASPGYVPPGWDAWASPSAGHPYAEFRYVLNENGRQVRYGRKPSDYLVDVLARKAVGFIKAQAGKHPFFAYVAPYAPHQPATPAPRYVNAFPGVQAPRPPSFDQPTFVNEPGWLSSRPPLSPTVLDYIQTLYRRRLQDMLAIDDLLRGVVTTLRQTGQLDHTYIFLGSDNGFHLGEHRLPPGKETAYDEDIRVPLFVRGPGIRAGGTVDQFAMNVDLAPTFAALAGAKAPSFVDGRSLVPLLGTAAPPRQWRGTALVEHFGMYRFHPRRRTTRPKRASPPTTGAAAKDPDDDESYNRAGAGASPRSPGHLPLSALNPYGVRVPPYHALRTTRYLYVEYVQGGRQLYDTTSDPYELRNIVASASPALVSSLHQQLLHLEQCHGQTCRQADRAVAGQG
ncbi:MAG: N-acetylglucosamine-6-sulfatase [Actinomycetota bacterium]|jgi:arylsulfatase A-like enzyme|nr:N-acetylglucosamine-6-sulfatase [Actinomycetota bacterium]